MSVLAAPPVLALCFAVMAVALPLPKKFWCSNTAVPWERCSIDGGKRMMEEIPHVPVPMAHWWETLKPYNRTCPSCTPIWLLCPAEDTGAWDGGSALRLGSRIMLEKINEQQWLLPGYELMCEYFNNDCTAKTAQKIVQGQSTKNSTKFVGVGSTGCSGVSNTLSSYTWTYNMPIISWASGAPDLSVRTTHRNFFRTVIPHTAFTFAWIQVYKLCGWEQIVVIMAEEARFRGHFTMHKEEIGRAGLKVAFEAQILDPRKQTDGVFTTIKTMRYRIIQVVTFENTWRAMMCSAYSLGIRDLTWLVFGVYSKGWYKTLDNPDLSQWKCGTKEMRMMANNAIYAMTVMWSQTMDVPLYCDKERKWTPQSYKDLFIKKMNEELKDPQSVKDRGGHAPKLGYGPAPADGVCLYAQTISKLLGVHPDGEKAPNGKKYALPELTRRSDEVYDQFNMLLQAASFNGVGNSPLSFNCEAMPPNKKCGDSCRNSPRCTGDLNGPTEIYQFDMNGRESSFDSYAADSEFPMRQIYDQSVEKAATNAAEKSKAYQWFTPFRFSLAGETTELWGGASSKMPVSVRVFDKCASGFLHVLGKFCVPEYTIPKCNPGEVRQDGICTACSENNFFDSVLLSCRTCFPGDSQPLKGQTSCAKCPEGKFTDPAKLIVECTNCTTGRYAESKGFSACTMCAAGTEQREPGQRECKSCDQGYFQPGGKNCQKCPGSFTTEYPGAKLKTSCLCPAGSFRDTGDRTKCKTCLEGMSCAFGADAALFSYKGNVKGKMPLVQPNYYTEKDQPLFVYRCLRKNACPGGEPGSCDGGRTGLACTLCPDNQVFSDGACKDCEAKDKALLFIIMGVCIIVVCVVYYMSNDKITIDASNTLALSVICGMGVTTLQLMGLLNQLALPWPSGPGGMLKGSAFLVFDPDSIAAECILGSDGVVRYALRVIVPYLAVLFVFVVMFVTRALKILRVTPWNTDKTRNTVGHMLQTLYIAFASIAATPFQCYSHPNGEKSVAAYPDVICGTSEHTPLIFLAMLLLLTFVIPFLGLTFWANWNAPARSVTEGSLGNHCVRYRFLFYRFRPDGWWWGSVVALRQLLLAFSAMVRPDDPYAQVMYVVTVLLVYITFASYFWAWKSHELNIIEVLGLVLLSLFMIVVAAFCPATKDKDSYATLMIVVLVLIFLNLACVFVFALFGVALRGTTSTFGFQYRDSIGKRDRLAASLHNLCCNFAPLDRSQVSTLLGLMSPFDRESVTGTVKAFKALNTEVFAEKGDGVQSRVSNIPTVALKANAGTEMESAQTVFATLSQMKLPESAEVSV